MIQYQSIETLMNMGWYLDTSLFKDFIERNIRKGFDTAEEHDGRTILRIKGLSKKVQIFVPVIIGSNRVTFELTRNMDHLRNIYLSNKTHFHYSELTKAEVLRALRRSHPQRNSSEILDWWHAFCFLLFDYERVELDFPIGEELSNLVLGFPIRKNVQDYLHLMIAKTKGLALITSDKLDGHIEDLMKSYYPHVYYWPDVRDMIPVDEIFKR